MALDGLVIHSIVDELSSKLIDAKIDKISQPEHDEIVINFRKNSSTKKLVLSASASNPRIYIANNYKKENPKKAPTFCMLCRKHLQGGTVIGICQIEFDRIVKIDIESFNELKEKTTKEIIIEIMGRHSNIILKKLLDNKIIDSIKRVPTGVSRVRQILPGLTYELPPSKDKLNPISNNSKELFLNTIKQSNDRLDKSLYSNFSGISPIIAKEICFRSNVDFKLNSGVLLKDDCMKLFNNFNNIFTEINGNKFDPIIVENQKINKYVDFSCLDLEIYDEFKKLHFDSISEVIENYYIKRDIKDRIHQKASNLHKSISIKLGRLYNKQKKQKVELEDSKHADEYKLKGELLTANIYLIKEGMQEIEVQNFYSEKLEKINIKLKINSTPSENAQKYFKKYNKLKTANREISRQMQINSEEISYLENTLLSIENCENMEELQDIKDELVKLGYAKQQGRQKTKKDVRLTTPPHKFISSDGVTIFVGKNNKQNDYLTLRIADYDDIWMHTKNIPGSHVIIKCAGQQVSEQALYQAAMLAAYYSKARSSSKVPVDYTKRKNVKKPSGSKPGMVIYETNSTIYVTPEEELVAKLKSED